MTDPLILVNLKLIYSLSPSQICKAIEVLLHCTLIILMQCNVTIYLISALIKSYLAKESKTKVMLFERAETHFPIIVTTQYNTKNCNTHNNTSVGRIGGSSSHWWFMAGFKTVAK